MALEARCAMRAFASIASNLQGCPDSTAADRHVAFGEWARTLKREHPHVVCRTELRALENVEAGAAEQQKRIAAELWQRARDLCARKSQEKESVRRELQQRSSQVQVWRVRVSVCAAGICVLSSSVPTTRMSPLFCGRHATLKFCEAAFFIFILSPCRLTAVPLSLVSRG